MHKDWKTMFAAALGGALSATQRQMDEMRRATWAKGEKFVGDEHDEYRRKVIRMAANAADDACEEIDRRESSPSVSRGITINGTLAAGEFAGKLGEALERIVKEEPAA